MSMTDDGRLEGEKLSDWLSRIADERLPKDMIYHAKRLEDRIAKLESMLDNLINPWLDGLISSVKTQEIWLTHMRGKIHTLDL
jgi:hypothetical protein